MSCQTVLDKRIAKKHLASVGITNRQPNKLLKIKAINTSKTTLVIFHPTWLAKVWTTTHY